LHTDPAGNDEPNMNERQMTPDSNGSYTHFPSPMRSYFFSILAIIASAVPAVWLAWLAMSAVGLQGVPLALATALTAMVLSVVFFAALVAIGRALKIIK
jgi:hypothetical protein